MELKVSKRRTLEINDAYHSVVLAANGVGVTGVSANTDDGDGGTSQADEGSHILEDNAQQSEDGGGGLRVSLNEEQNSIPS